MNFLQIMLWGCHHSTVVLHITVLNHFLGVSCLYIGDALCVKGTMLFNSWLEAQFLCLFDPKPDLFVLFLFNPLLSLYLFFPFRFNSPTPIHLCLLEEYIYIYAYIIYESCYWKGSYGLILQMSHIELTFMRNEIALGTLEKRIFLMKLLSTWVFEIYFMWMFVNLNAAVLYCTKVEC